MTLDNAKQLRDHLDGLNDAGNHPVAVGKDANGSPFLITLVGPYAESEEVFFDSPWQSDTDWVNGATHCRDCGGHYHGIDDLAYPVTLMA